MVGRHLYNVRVVELLVDFSLSFELLLECLLLTHELLSAPGVAPRQSFEG